MVMMLIGWGCGCSMVSVGKYERALGAVPFVV